VRYQGALFSANFATLNAETPVDAVWPIAVRACEDRHGAADAHPDAQPRAALDQDVSAAAHGMRAVRCNMRDSLSVTEREVQVINVEMNQVEILFFAENLVQHYHMMR
jgi:hypothetical protein